MTPERRKLVLKLREEGREAARLGKHQDTCPHKFMDKFQWLRGYHEELEDERRQDQ